MYQKIASQKKELQTICAKLKLSSKQLEDSKKALEKRINPCLNWLQLIT